MKLDYMQQPAVEAFGTMSYHCPEPIVLENGTKLYVVDGGAQEINKIEVAFRGGTFDEEKPMVGTLTSSMIVHGSNNYSSQEVAEKLDYYGSWFGSRCMDCHSLVSMHSLNRCFADTLPMFVDIIRNPVFPVKEYELLQGKMRSAYRTARRKVKYLANLEAARLFFGDEHPLACNVVDEHFDRLTIDDLKAFHSRFYRPANCTIILSGKITDKERELVMQLFGSLPEQRCSTPIAIPEEHRSERRFSIVDCQDAVQAGVTMMMPAIPRFHPDYIKLRVLVMALGGYFGSRLMSNVREDKGYTYGINASLLGRISGAHIVIGTECDNRYVGGVIKEVKYEIKRLVDELIPEEELEMVKSFIMSDLVKMFDTPFALASYIASTVFFGVSPDYFNRQVQEISTLTAHDLRDVARKYFDTDDITVAVVGDRSKIEPTLSQL